MKVHSLLVENVKRIVYAFINVKSQLIKVAGRNAQGKTSLLDGLRYALEGERSIPGDPKRTGSDRAIIDVELIGNDGLMYHIIRKFTKKGTSLEIVDSKGEVLPGMAWLKKQMIEGTIDAMSILQKKPAELRTVLLKLVGADTAQLDADYKAQFDERTIVGRQVENAKARLQGAAFSQDVDGMKETSASSILEELSQAKDKNDALDDMTEKRITLRAQEDLIKKEIERQKSLLEKVVSDIDGLDLLLLGAEKIDTALISARLKLVESINGKIRGNVAYYTARREHAEAEKNCESLTEKLESINIQKVDLLKNAKWPIPGLSVDADGVVFNGFPISEASEAERIKTAIAIVAAMIPKDGLRLLRVNNGSLLDKDSLFDIEMLAQEKDVQVWIETVQNDVKDGDGTEIFIEDGKILGQVQQEALPL